MATPTEPSAADKEAHEYWGYLFNPDKTGTDRFKNLLRGLHQLIGSKFEPYDSSDLTPAQLAHFYRALNGNYDQLFLNTPPTSIGFIYKNLGCLHSLQPLPTAGQENRFAEATIPALKAEGWIMWQTIQVLLGPEEHAGFLMQAVRKWNVKDPITGDLFPKILPRSSFPAVPDAHMVAWYEGVSDRLRREAEEEQTMRITPIDDEPRLHIESGERPHHHHYRHDKDRHASSSDEDQADSRRSALAYFRNPLFRTNDGRPSVVRRSSKQPPQSPRRPETLVEKSKSAATTVSHVVRNIGSPFLWDGGSAREKEREKDRDHRDKEKDRDKERDRRRRSHPHANIATGDDSELSEGAPSPRLRPRHSVAPSMRGSAAHSPASEQYDPDRPTPSERKLHNHHNRNQSFSSGSDHTIRHIKSHDPVPSPKEYFPPYDTYKARRSSAQANSPLSPGYQAGDAAPTSHTAGRVSTPTNARGRTSTPSTAPNSAGGYTPATENKSDEKINYGGFWPTASPLFATQIARKDQASHRNHRPTSPGAGPGHTSRSPPLNQSAFRNNGPPRSQPNVQPQDSVVRDRTRRAHGRESDHDSRDRRNDRDRDWERRDSRNERDRRDEKDRQARPKVTRFESPQGDEQSTDGRRYPHEMSRR